MTRTRDVGQGARRPEGNLPGEASGFVGRQREVAEGKAVLSRARLLTITGAPGVGKSRLGLRVAAQVRRRFPDGVWVVDLAGLDDGELLPHTVMNTLGAGDWSMRSPVETLSEYLEQRRLLLVLDNCEHLVETCAGLANVLLRKAPGLRIITTSRHVLGADGEHVVTLSPLPVPSDGDQALAADAVSESPAVQLFAMRAAALVRGFAVDEDNCETVARICRRLEGVPLAIELVASWLQTLSADEILTGLDAWPGPPAEMGSFLRGDLAPLRHQTLRATFDWSFDLCSSAERRVWARSSVFAGDFDIATAEAVCTDETLPPEEVLDLVVALVDKSVLSREDEGGRTRYRLLAPTQQYGRQRLLELGEEALLRRRHRDYYLQFAERAEHEWFGSQQIAWSERMRREQANLRAALEFCLAETGEEKVGLRLAGALWFCWIACGWIREGRYWLEHVLGRTSEPSRIRARALWANAWVALMQGDTLRALPMLEESRALARQFADQKALTCALAVTGIAEVMRSNPQRAMVYLESVLQREQTLGYRDPLTLISRPALANAFLQLGHSGRARELCEECLTICRERGILWEQSWALWVLAIADWADGDTRQACVHAREGLRIKKELNDLVGAVLSIELLAWAEARDGDPERAAQLLGASYSMWQTIGRPLFGFGLYLAWHDRSESKARRTLGPRAFETAFHEGTKLTFDEASTYALGTETGRDELR